MKINSLKTPLIIENNEHPKRLKKGGAIKKAEGGIVLEEEIQDPLVKKTTAPKVVVVPADQYDPATFASELEKYKGKKLPMKDGRIQLKGPLASQVNPLTTSVKTTQDYLFDYMKANKKDSLTSAEANSLLQKAKMGTYDDYIAKAKNLKAYRDITVVPAKALNQSVELGGTYNPVTGGGISMEPTTPFDSTHYEYTFPKDTYVAPQKKAKGGKVYKDGIKGYIQGGDIQEQTIRDTSVRPLEKGLKANLRDAVLFNIDNPLSTIGLGNVIKDEEYHTATGKKGNQLNYGIQKIGPGVAGGILDYFIPGAGTAMKTGVGALESTQGQDEGLNAGQSATQEKAGKAVNIGGGILGGMGKNKKGESGEDEVVAESTIDENGIDTTTGEIAVYDTQPTQVTSGENLTGQALSDWKSALTGEAKAQVLEKYNTGGYGLKKGGEISAEKARKILHDGTINGRPITEQQRKFFGAMSNKKADGGKIVGKGTGTSDSIPASLEDDGFVVPAVNAKIAEELRAKYLGDAKGKIASLKKGGVPVKVSNGEHYFTKEEKELLISKGVDVDALAPNADVSENGKANGGDIERKRIEKNYLTYVERQKAIKANPEKFSEKEIADTEKNLRTAYEAYKSLPKTAKKQSALEKMESAVASESKALAEKRSKRTPEETANLAGIKKPTYPKTGGIASVGTTPTKKQSSLGEMEVLPTREILATETKPTDVATIDTTITPVSATTPPAEKKKFNPLERMDVGKGIALAQTGLGLSQLMQDGERPVDALPADFSQSVADAQTEAQFGISPLERRIAERGIDRNRAADEQTIINLSGGSAGTALANIRAASISANESKGNLSAMSEALRLQKKRYADSLVSQKADRSKQLFNEKLNAFNVDQQAGAELLGAGIRNVIGSSRLDRELAAQQEREAKYNPTFNIS